MHIFLCQQIRMKAKENEKFDNYKDLARELKKLRNMKVTVISVIVGALGTVPQEPEKDVGYSSYQRKNQDHPKHITAKISYNTEKSPGDLRRFAVTQTSLEGNQLLLVWKFPKEKDHNNDNNNETHKILWDFEIEADHLISARRPDLMIVNKEKKTTCRIVDFAIPANHWVKLKDDKKR